MVEGAKKDVSTKRVIKLFQNQQELVKQLTEKELLLHLFLTQVLCLIISMILAYFLFDDLSSFLSIWELDWQEILLFGGLTALLIILVDFWMMKIFPFEWLDDGGINERIFQKRTIPEIFVLTFLISFSEELLFRGVLQTHFGIVISSIIFAILHFRYLSKWLLLIMVTAISFILGFVYEWTGNLWTTIFSHFLIDFVLALYIRFQYIFSTKKGGGSDQ